MGGGLSPEASIDLRSRSASPAASLASCAERKRRSRCWFILARGATPSMARNSTLRGRTAANSRSTSANTAIIMSCSVAGAGRPSGWQQGCTRPFMSMYKQSNSSPLGLGSVSFSGIRVPPVSTTRSSTQSISTFGYLIVIHLKKPGTPMAAAGAAGGCLLREGGGESEEERVEQTSPLNSLKILQGQSVELGTPIINTEKGKM